MRYIFTLLFIVAASVAGMAQYSMQLDGRKSTLRPDLSEKTVVKDASGSIVPFKTWKSKIQSGDFYVKSVFTPGKQTQHILLPSTPEIKAFYAQKKAEMEKEDATSLAAKADNDTTIVQMNPVPEDDVPPPVASKKIDFSVYPKPMESSVFKTGEKFKPFRARDLDGNVFNMKELAGKTVVLNFWFIDCPPCRMEMPDLNTLKADYANNPNVVFFSVALDSESRLRQFLASTPFSYPVAPAGQEIAGWYSIRQYPTNLVIGPKGEVKFHAVGYSPATAYWIKKSIDEEQ